MKANGSIYVSMVFAVLIGYFSYQWWFNPHREIKRRLGQIAVTLSIPANETDLGRVARLAQLRQYLANEVRVRAGRSGPEFSSRDAVVAAASGWTPAGGWNVDFVDVDVKVDSNDAARAYVTVDTTMRDPETGQQTLDSREAQLALAQEDGEWLIREVDVKDPPQPPLPR
jgi:hypothetical protein